MSSRVGFIGLGKMGKPMAANLLKAGYSVLVHNRSLKQVEELALKKAIPCKTPAEMAANVDILHLCLPEGKDVSTVVSGLAGVLESAKPGMLIIDHSTIAPDASIIINEQCGAKGVFFLDAPVSGGVTGAENGTLSIMVGGDPGAFERALPILKHLGKNIAHVGPSGSGNKMKLINQMLVGITQCAVAEAMVLAAKIGLEPTQTYNVLSNSVGDSAILRRSIPNFVFKRDFTAAFTLNLLNKDMKLLSQLAHNYNVRMLIGTLAQQVCLEGSLAGYGDQDMSAVIRVMEKLAGIEVMGGQ